MKSSARIARGLVVSALATVFIASFIAFTSYAVGRPPTPPPPPPPTPTNGKIAFLRTDTDYTVNGIYLIDPDGTNEQRVPYTETDSTPVWSPNGMRLAVIHLASPHSGAVSGYGVEVMNADGSGRVRFNDNVEPGERIAWSPDGTKIAYTSWSNFSPNADIMVMDANTGADIANLTNDPAYDYLPTWSPDGSQIAFTSNRSGNLDVFVMNADGSNPQNITNYSANDYYPSWSPDGSKIVFVSSARGGTFDNDEICVMNADGSNVVNLTVNQVTDLMPTWSPDGTKIIFNSDRNGNRDLYSINADGSNETRVTVHTAEDSRASWQQTPISTPTPTPTPSPAPPLNGNIAFTRVGPPAERVATINEDGSNLTDLTAGSNAEDPEFSPDGTRIAFSSVSNGQFRISVMNADGSGLMRLTNNGVRGDDEPTWSPDGSKIAFVGGSQILVINADGTNEINLSGSRTGDNDPDWSPDGSKIVFTKDYSSPNAQTFVMNTDGSNLVNLSNTAGSGAERDPAWSPDGSKIAYQSFQDSHYEIYVMNADGSGETRITNTAYPLANEHPDWSPDGLKIVFSSTRDNEQEIYVMNADGTSQTRLTNDPVLDEHPSWGRYVAAPTPTPTPTPAADMSVFGSATPAYVPSGGQVNYSITTVNGGPEPAASVTISGQLPAGVTFNSFADNGGGACNGTPGGASFDCTFDSIPAGESRAISVLATATGTPYELIQTTFNVTSSTPDSSPGNNASIAEFRIASPPLPTPTPGPVNELQLAYTQFDQSTFQHDIFRQRADAAQLLNLTNSAADESGFVWSPDGSKLVFLRLDFANQTASSYAMSADGSNLVQLTNVPGEYISQIIWSPNSSKLLFSVFPYSNDTPDGQIYVMNADGTGRTNVSGTDGFNTEPAWSPDGSKISFKRTHFFPSSPSTSDLYVANANGTNPIQIAHATGDRDSAATWSPDGTLLAFTRSFADNTNQVFTVRPDGSQVLQVINAPDTQTSGPQWSPDGRLSFSSFNNNTFATALEAANYNGSGRVTIYSPPQGGLFYALNGWKFSPDGSQLAFSYIVGEAQGANVCVVNANGTGLHCIGSSDQEYNDAPDWSPDGARLAFISNRNGVRSIDLVNADGTGRVELTRGDVAAPKWRPTPPQGNTPAGSNVTVTQNGASVTFSNVTTAGETTVTPIDPNSLTGVPSEYVINANSLAFEIHTTAVYSGPITIGFQVPGVNNPITFSALRVLHGEPPPVPNFVDRTVLAPDTPAPDFATRTIYARVTSLSPFIVLQRKDPFPPVTTATLSAQPNAAGWHKANVTVTLTATDNAGGSGVQSLTYSATGAQPIAQTTINGNTKAIAITTAGTTTITYRAKDVSGNIETAKTITVKLDKTVPGATTSTVNPAANSSGYSNGLSGPPTVTLAAIDPGTGASGIAGFYVSATGAHTIPANTFVPVANPIVPITHDGTTTLSYRAVDQAGNEGATASRTIKVDATPPTTSYSVSSSGANITLTVNFNDNLSGYAAVNYSVDNGQWQTYTGPFPSNGSFSSTFNGPYHESGTYVIRYYGTDKAGNNESTKTATFTIPPQAITPTLASVTHNSNGTWTAKFGYRNDNPVTFNIAVGASNKFSPGNQSRGQTTAFQPGTVANAFTVTWDGSSLTWTVKGPDGQTRSVLAKKP